MNLKFKIDKRWPKRSWFDRFCARHVCKMIVKENFKSYQFGGYTGAKKLSYELVNAECFQLMHWVLREAGYSCCAADVMERCGIDYEKKEKIDEEQRTANIG